MRTALILVALLAVTPALAQPYDPYAPPRPRGNGLTKGVQTYDERNAASLRVGTACQLKLYGEDVFPSGAGLCNVSRGQGPDRDRVTLIDTGARRYRLVRDAYDDGQGTFYAGGEALPVVARGSCWVGRDVRFCAN